MRASNSVIYELNRSYRPLDSHLDVTKSGNGFSASINRPMRSFDSKKAFNMKEFRWLDSRHIQLHSSLR